MLESVTMRNMYGHPISQHPAWFSFSSLFSLMFEVSYSQRQILPFQNRTRLKRAFSLFACPSSRDQFLVLNKAEVFCSLTPRDCLDGTKEGQLFINAILNMKRPNTLILVKFMFISFGFIKQRKHFMIRLFLSVCPSVRAITVEQVDLEPLNFQRTFMR